MNNKESLGFSKKDMKKIVKDAPKDTEITGAQTAYYFKITKEKINAENPELAE